MTTGNIMELRFYLLPYGFRWCLYPAPPRCPECFDLSRWGSSRLAANVWEPPVQLSRLLLDPVIRPRCLEPYSGPGCVVLSEGRFGWRTVDEPISSSTLAAIVSYALLLGCTGSLPHINSSAGAASGRNSAVCVCTVF